MEDRERACENEEVEGEWDWEVLADDDHLDHHRQHKSSSSDGGGGGGGGGGSGVICSDYFSLEFNSPSHLNNTDSEGVNTDTDMDMDTDKDSSGSTTSSWVDPPEPQLANNSNNSTQRSRDLGGGSSGDTSGCSSDSDSSNGKLLEKLLQPHSTCDSSHHLHLPPLPLEPKDADDNTDTHASIQDGTPIPSPPNNDPTNNKTGWAWWKVPLEVLKYCVFRVNPVSVWSLSFAAAAVMGFFLLRRTWFSKIKRKSPPGISLKLTVDDKKVSQFMSRASRLNEAFSVVKRVPIIRPAFPAPGLAPWPAMSLR